MTVCGDMDDTKSSSFSVVRSHKVDPCALEAQRRKEQEQKKREQMNEKPVFKASQGFQLGDLWGGGPTFAKAVQTPVDTQIDTLSGKIEALHLEKKDRPPSTPTTIIEPVDNTILPRFPGEYLYVSEEATYDPYGGHDAKRYQKYMDMEADVDEQATTSNGEWQGETYEKQQLPRGVDKQFKKFTERVEQEPSQCVRYEWNGTPLLFCQLEESLATRRCDACGGPRVFEFQLMPNILSVLPTVKHAASAESTRQSSNPDDPKVVLNSWSVGMEFGHDSRVCLQERLSSWRPRRGVLRRRRSGSAVRAGLIKKKRPFDCGSKFTGNEL